jgi:translation initiation factor IF-2
MSEEAKPMQLPKAASMCNVSTATVVAELQKKGFSVDNKPTTKLTPEMMAVLIKEFNVDMGHQGEAAQVELGGSKKRENIELDASTALTEKKNKEKESEEIRIKTTIVPPAEKETKVEIEKKPEMVETKSIKLEGPKIVGNIDLGKKEKTAEPKKTEASVSESDAKKANKKGSNTEVVSTEKEEKATTSKKTVKEKETVEKDKKQFLSDRKRLEHEHSDIKHKYFTLCKKVEEEK